MKKKSVDHDKDFQEFLNATPSLPPARVSEAIRSRIGQDLNPSAWLVFSKLSAIHLLTSLITLSFCPQFGFRILGEGMGLMQVFMAFGTYGCMIACGFFFMGTSLMVATLALTPEEIKAVRKHRFSELGALAFLSLGFFIMVDAEVVIGIAMLWLLGSILGAVAILEAGWALRRQVWN